jgi:hypothetical protein
VDGNWSPLGTPTPGDSVIVPPTATSPVIFVPQQQIAIASLNIQAGGQLTLTDSLRRFIVKGDVSINGTMRVPALTRTSIEVGGSWIVNSPSSFEPGQSTVYFAGQGSCERNFFNLAFDSTAAMASAGNITVTNACTPISNVTLRPADTLFIQNANPLSLSGVGKIDSGTIQRKIQPGSIQSYRFESDSTNVRFYSSGTNPTWVSMTMNGPGNGVAWQLISSKLDTLSNTITADSVPKFSRWAIGVIRQGLSRPLHSEPLGVNSFFSIIRYFDIAADADTGFLAKLEFRYEQSELPTPSSEDSLVLMRTDSVMVGVREGQPSLPMSYSLDQNFPNPFNPATTIRYTLPRQSSVLLEVFDILGRKVSTLANGVEEPGYHSVIWNSGRVASGVYFYRFQATSSPNPTDTFERSGKMLFLR